MFFIVLNSSEFSKRPHERCRRSRGSSAKLAVEFKARVRESTRENTRRKFVEPDFAKRAKVNSPNRTGVELRLLGLRRSQCCIAPQRRRIGVTRRRLRAAVCTARSALIIRELSLDLCELIHFGAASSDFQRWRDESRSAPRSTLINVLVLNHISE